MLNIRKLFRNKTVQEIPDSINKQVIGTAEINPVNESFLNRRLGQIYGEDLMSLQLLYENWAVKESWLIKDEALPLLAALDPADRNNYEVDTENSLNEIWEHARSCVEQGLLPVLNREETSEKWRARPVDIYRWARTSRISFPDILANLMEFISTTIKQPLAQNTGTDFHDATAARFVQDRERVLGMALAILAAYPDKCRNSKGRVKVDKIINIINEKRSHWLGDEELILSPTAIRDLINKWLNTVSISTD